MKLGQQELELLSNTIIKNLKEEFKFKHLSGNLINTIVVENLGDEIKIHIPAETYNMLEYKRNKVIIHTNRGSYASQIDKEGSVTSTHKGKGTEPRNHIGYINNVINKSIMEWRSAIDSKVISVEG